MSRMLAGAMAGLGKGLSDAGSMMFEVEKDEMLQRFAMARQKDQQAFASEQSSLDREARATESAADRAQRQPQIDAAIAKTRQEIEAGEYSLQEAEQLNSVLNQITNAKTPEERDAAYDLYQRLTGNLDTNRYSGVTLYGDENEFGVQTRGSAILDQQTGEIRPAGRAQPSGGESGIPQAAIQELQEAIASGDLAAIEEFEEAFGPGSAAAYRPAGSPAPAPREAPASASTSSPAPPTEAQGGSGSGFTPTALMRSVAGLSNPGNEPAPMLAPPGEGEKSARPLGGGGMSRLVDFLSKGPARQAGHFQEQASEAELRPALTFVNNAVAQGEFPAKETATQRRLIQQAIDSGQLDPALAEQLQAYLQGGKAHGK